ncbi:MULTISPECIES: hypothetical protein [Bradyrhizobium]|uniref:Uncharacterized protein n=1 Tax=Bradyrhizobium frederickii TaxID=2560054 RepID=A0A4Y9KNJ7_9BRAD|nr:MULTISPECIES: hypothetical protein [Bradyrhizobium]TFV27790.1 hypothetical protein E4K66_39465 [Bradyrhizobium frederickii]TFV67096.1 hypothetical protein E4K64_39010 [Bradyrhizobium frederickii]
MLMNAVGSPRQRDYSFWEKRESDIWADLEDDPVGSKIKEAIELADTAGSRGGSGVATEANAAGCHALLLRHRVAEPVERPARLPSGSLDAASPG